MKKYCIYIIEALMLVILAVFLYPFVIVFIYSAKNSFSVTQYPMRLPADWGQIFINMRSIITDPNIRYGSSFISSILITGLSLMVLTLVAQKKIIKGMVAASIKG